MVTDASPWGLGFVGLGRGGPLCFGRTPISEDDERVFSTQKGKCTDQAIWEALAILCGVKSVKKLLWHPDACKPRSLMIHTDSTAAMGSLSKMRSPDPRLSTIAREFAMTAALYQLRFLWKHLPGAQNDLADALSRGKRPRVLTSVKDVPVPHRSKEFWITRAPPRASEASEVFLRRLEI